jgi:hypothetical protein
MSAPYRDLYTLTLLRLLTAGCGYSRRLRISPRWTLTEVKGSRLTGAVRPQMAICCRSQVGRPVLARDDRLCRPAVEDELHRSSRVVVCNPRRYPKALL